MQETPFPPFRHIPPHNQHAMSLLRNQVPFPMSASRADHQLAFRFKPLRMTLWLILFATLTLGFLWMAYASLAPGFYDSASTGRHAWVGDMLGGLPVPARVGIWATLSALCGYFGFLLLQRWLSGLPVLAASPEGVTGFTKGIGLRQITIPWGEITRVEAIQSNLFVHGTAIDTGSVRRPKPPVVTANLSMMGESFASVTRALEAYRASLAAAE
jgi:hypothetical protein